MGTVEHSTLTTSDLHEPRGIDNEVKGRVYISDGAGSGNWRHLPNGWGYYKDSGTAQSITTAATKLTINASDASSTSTYLPLQIAGTDELWDTATNTIKPIKVGDVYQVRLDLPISATTGSPTLLTVQVDVGGGATPTDVVVAKEIPATGAATYDMSVEMSLAVLSDFNTNGGQIFLSTDAGTVSVDDPAILITKISDGAII